MLRQALTGRNPEVKARRTEGEREVSGPISAEFHDWC